MASKKGHVVVTPADFTHPKSLYAGWKPPHPVTDEAVAIEDLKPTWDEENPGEDPTFRLEHFSFYRFDGELEPLSVLRSKFMINKLLCDGILVCGGQRRYVQGVEFHCLCVERYGDPEMGSVNVYIQTVLGEKKKTYYILGKPAPEYHRYHHGFLWIANFGRYFVDWLDQYPDTRLEDFRERFHAWVKTTYQGFSHSRWLSEYGHKDFRVAVSAYVDYLFHESVLLNEEHESRFIWKECLPSNLTALKEWKQVQEKTVCTKLVHEIFGHMYFQEKLLVREPVAEIAEAQEQRKAELGFMNTSTRTHHSKPTPVIPENWVPRKGDFVRIKKDAEGDSDWEIKADFYYAYVQDTRHNRKEELLLDVIWLYRPEETVIFDMKYLYENELFFSDHCNCKERNQKASDVLGRVDIVLDPKSLPGKDQLFIRQTYSADTQAFTTFKPSETCCSCRQARRSAFDQVAEKFNIGDCVYVLEEGDKSLSGHDGLEPVILVSLQPETKSIVVRRLLRRHRDCQAYEGPTKGIRPNELVWTNIISHVKAEAIIRPCHIRYFDSGMVKAGEIPVPYNRDGAIDCWYFCLRLLAGQLHKFNNSPSFNQGFDPRPTNSSMKGISLFAGGGSFDRGLEECGGVQTVVAVDFSKAAAHTFRANRNCNGRPTDVFYGSVDDHLSGCLSGDPQIYARAPIGLINFLSAGSPCPGFSTMQKNKFSAKSLTNASHITTFTSYVDLYRPAYAILENVLGMATPVKGDRVLSQIVACLVSMGYQVQISLGDAWSYGDPQGRSRLFVTITAPGLQPPSPPVATHSHPAGTQHRTFGDLPNKQRFGERQVVDTPFQYISAEMATKDLPDIGDSRVEICIPFPDHRCNANPSFMDRRLMSLIPTSPGGQGLMSAIALEKKVNEGNSPGDAVVEIIPTAYKVRQSGYSKQRQDSDPAKNHCWQRVPGDHLFATVKTGITPGSARYGKVVHWSEPRAMSIQEARRAQGIPDDEVMIGSLQDQWSIVGNGVARSVALAWGASFREAWLSNEAGAGDSRRHRINHQYRVSSMIHEKAVQTEKARSGPIEKDVDDSEDEDEVEHETTVTEEISVMMTKFQRATSSRTVIGMTSNTTIEVCRPRTSQQPKATDQNPQTKLGTLSMKSVKRAPLEIDETEQPRKRTRNTGLTITHTPTDYSKRVETPGSRVCISDLDDGDDY
jgi:DNA (cytosine-5)-methyltransferase 1